MLKLHKQLAARYPRQGAGIEAFVDASDTGEGLSDGTQPTTDGEKPTPTGVGLADNPKGQLKGNLKATANGTQTNGSMTNGH